MKDANIKHCWTTMVGLSTNLFLMNVVSQRQNGAHTCWLIGIVFIIHLLHVQNIGDNHLVITTYQKQRNAKVPSIGIPPKGKLISSSDSPFYLSNKLQTTHNNKK